MAPAVLVSHPAVQVDDPSQEQRDVAESRNLVARSCKQTAGAGQLVGRVLRYHGDPSAKAKQLALQLRSNLVGPVLSLRTDFQNCSGTDIQVILCALAECKSVHLLSTGRNDALANSTQLGDLLVRALAPGYVWACDWGELCFRCEVIDDIICSLEGTVDDKPRTNLAFVFADIGCGIAPGYVQRLKDVTRRRRSLDKAVPPQLVGRTRAPWLLVQPIFGWVMRSENLTRCFWRPYQEPEFWRRAGFPCPRTVRPKGPSGNRWVNPMVRPLMRDFQKGESCASTIATLFPPGKEGEDRSAESLQKALQRAKKFPPHPHESAKRADGVKTAPCHERCIAGKAFRPIGATIDTCKMNLSDIPPGSKERGLSPALLKKSRELLHKQVGKRMRLLPNVQSRWFRRKSIATAGEVDHRGVATAPAVKASGLTERSRRHLERTARKKQSQRQMQKPEVACKVDLWIGCDACSQWFQVNRDVYNSWEGEPFTCTNIGETCLNPQEIAQEVQLLDSWEKLDKAPAASSAMLKGAPNERCLQRTSVDSVHTSRQFVEAEPPLEAAKDQDKCKVLLLCLNVGH